MSKISAIIKAAGDTAESKRTWWLSVKPFLNADKHKVRSVLEKAFGNKVLVADSGIKFYDTIIDSTSQSQSND